MNINPAEIVVNSSVFVKSLLPVVVAAIIIKKIH